jgi:RimJ/RimL family protein N-acetyltransferase
MTLDIPTIETENLILRAPRESDLDAMAVFSQSERSHWVGGPKNRHGTWRVLIGMLGHWAVRGYGLWHIEEKATGTSVGAAGIINHEGWQEPELGWHVYDEFEGKGLAFEATLAARQSAAEKFGLNSVISYIDPANIRSVALAKRLGATYECDAILLDEPCQIYRHPKLEALT